MHPRLTYSEVYGFEAATIYTELLSKSQTEADEGNGMMCSSVAIGGLFIIGPCYCFLVCVVVCVGCPPIVVNLVK